MPRNNKLLFVGDIHGNTRWAQRAISEAVDKDIDTIVQVGDFGYWEHTDRGVEYLDDVSGRLVDTGIKLYWVDGNHENHPLLYAKYPLLDDDGFRQVRENLLHIPRAHSWTWGGVKFLGLGGAYSIDKAFRTPGNSWWPEETITDEEAKEAMGVGKVDVMVTHDCPVGLVPWDPYGLLDRQKDLFPASLANRQVLTEVFKVAKPKLLVHGHYHYTYTASLGLTQVRGLGCDGDPEWSTVVELGPLRSEDTNA